MKFSSPAADKLVVLALILFVVSVFLPWVGQQYIYFTYWPSRSIQRVDWLFWSFMARRNEETSFFNSYWFPEQEVIAYHASWNGLYLGWFLVFVLQILTVAYSIVYSLHLKLSVWLREHHSVWLVTLPLLTLVFAVYQMFVQKEMMYRDLGLNPIWPNVGFVTAFLSTVILLVAVWKVPEQSHLKAIPKAFKSAVKRRWPVLILLFVVAFPVVGELQAQTSVSKNMVVGDSGDFDAIHEDPSLWGTHFDRISLLASFFRARIIYNSPEYAYCGLEVPVVSYAVLAALLTMSGYYAREPEFMHLLTPE